MKNIKNFEDHVIKNVKDLGNNWSATYHVNKEKGLVPYKKSNKLLVKVDVKKTIPHDAIYTTPEKAEEYNKKAKEIIKLERELDNIENKL
jgi:ribosomal protein L17